MQLSTYFRSSAAWRVRIALALKGIAATQDFVHLLKDGGQQKSAAFRRKNPMGVVPVLELDDGTLLTQSIAIIEYLEETHPTPVLLPVDPIARAKVRAFALAIACDIHPLNNLRVLQYLEKMLGQDQQARNEWYHHWIAEGLTALEALLQDAGGRSVLLRRHARPCGRLPGAADGQCTPLQMSARRVSDIAPRGSRGARITGVPRHCA
jgi:maleylacetoacetate isomerase